MGYARRAAVGYKARSATVLQRKGALRWALPLGQMARSASAYGCPLALNNALSARANGGCLYRDGDREGRLRIHLVDCQDQVRRVDARVLPRIEEQ